MGTLTPQAQLDVLFREFQAARDNTSNPLAIPLVNNAGAEPVEGDNTLARFLKEREAARKALPNPLATLK